MGLQGRLTAPQDLVHVLDLVRKSQGTQGAPPRGDEVKVEGWSSECSAAADILWRMSPST